MKKIEDINVKYSIIPDNIRTQYNLDDKVTNDGYVYIKIKKAFMVLNKLPF